MPTPATYSRTQIVLHWLTVLLILAQFTLNGAIGAAWRAFRTGTEIAFDPLVAAHVFGGIAILVLALWRLVLRATHGVPPAQGSAWAVRAAHWGHVAIYAALILVAISGGAAWFGGIEAAAEAHEVLKTVLLVLVVGHVAMALWHQFVLRDGTLARMR